MVRAPLRVLACVAAAWLCGCDAGPDAPRARARRLSASDIHPEHEAERARAGDVVLENDQVRFVITGSRGSDTYGDVAGVVVDAALVRRAGEPAFDGIDELTPTVNRCPIDASAVTITRDGADGGPAEVLVAGREVAIPGDGLTLLGTRGEEHGLDVEVRYALEPGARALRITTTVHNPNAASVPLGIGDFLGFGTDEVDAFTLPGGKRAALEEQPELVGSAHETLRWAAALYPEKGRLALPADATIKTFTSTGEGGLWQYTVLDATLAPGQRQSATRFLALGRDVAEVLAARADPAALGTVRGLVGSADRPLEGARVSFFTGTDGASFVSQATSDEAGRFAAQLPAGRYRAVVSGRGNGEHVQVPGFTRVLAEGHPGRFEQEVTVRAGEEVRLVASLEPAGAVELRVREGATGSLPFKVTFQAESALPPPLLSVGEEAPYPELGLVHVFWSRGEDVRAHVMPGTYTVTASAGPSHGVETHEGVVIAPGANPPLDFELTRHVPELGYVAIDSHLHGMDSQHGGTTRSERVITAAAEGLEVHVAADHSRIVDYGPLVRELELEARVLAVPGVELDTFHGDFTVWPLRFDPAASNGGAARYWLGGTLDELFDHYVARGGKVFTVAHGRDYFTRAGFDPATGTVEDPDAFTFRFNSMELHNGKRGGGRDFLVPTWYALLAAGRRIAPLAASDSHWRIPEAGVGRTYVWLGDAPRTAGALADAVIAMRTVASTGPLIDFTGAEGTLRGGDTASGGVRVRIAVWAPAWMPIARVRLIANGAPLVSWDAASTPAVAAAVAPGEPWFVHELELAPEVDTWYAVEAEGDQDLAPVYPSLTPWAHTAPIFVTVP